MIQPYYCEEKLDVGHSQGLKGEYSWVERGAVKVNGTNTTQWPGQVSNPDLSPPGVQCTNYWVAVSPDRL